MNQNLPKLWSAESHTGLLDTLRSSRDFMERTPDAASLHAFAFRANGDLWLIEVTRKTWRRVWSFGQ